jgi:hypothetical protein
VSGCNLVAGSLPPEIAASLACFGAAIFVSAGRGTNLGERGRHLNQAVSEEGIPFARQEKTMEAWWCCCRNT